MEVETIIAYVVCDDTLKNMNIKNDPQSRMSNAEIMTTVIIAALEFSGNIEKARKALKLHRYIPNMLSKSQFNRRLHAINKDIWQAVLIVLYTEFGNHGMENTFIVDSFPVPTTKLARKQRSKLYSNDQYVGYCAAKKEFFLGLKLHMISSASGMPVQMLLLPASISDISGFKQIDLSLQKNSVIYADKAYNDYLYEDRLMQEKQIHLIPLRKKNSKRKGSEYLARIRKRKRRMIETAFSCIEKLMPRSIHAVTKLGLELKAMLFVVAYAFSKAISMVTT